MGAERSTSAYITELEDVAARAIKALDAIQRAAERLQRAEELLRADATAAYAVRGAHSYVRAALAAFQGES